LDELNKLTKSYKPYELQELITMIVREVVNNNGYNHTKIKKIIKKHKKSDSSDSSSDSNKENTEVISSPKVISSPTDVKSHSIPPQLLEDDEKQPDIETNVLKLNILLKQTKEQFTNKHYDIWLGNVDKFITKLNAIIYYIKTNYPHNNYSLGALSLYKDMLATNINQLKSKKDIIDNLHIETENSISELRLVQKSIEIYVELFLNVLKGIDNRLHIKVERKYFKEGSDYFKLKALKYKEKYLQLKNQFQK
jgi:hypothetical protein